MNHKKYFFIMLIIPFVFLIFIASYVVYSDPLQIFPKGYFIQEKYNGNMREQAKGIIDNVDFDSVILGTSMLENSSAIEASKLLNAIFVNLSISGGTFYERAFILDYLFNNKKIKNVIYSFDDNYSENSASKAKQDDIWPLLYCAPLYESIKIYYNLRFLRRSFLDIFTTNYTNAKVTFFDKKNEWSNNPYHACRFGGLEKWISNINKQGIKEFFCKELPSTLSKIENQKLASTVVNRELVDNAQAYIDKNILNYVFANHDTNFYIIIPPYYRYSYAKTRQAEPQYFILHQEMVRYLVNQSNALSNLNVYGFEDMIFLDDIANYKDTKHYHQSFNSIITESIASGEHLLTPENIDAYLIKCDYLAHSFDIKKLYDDACTIMLEQGIDPKTGERK